MMVDLILAAPKDEDVVAGPIGFVIFIGLCLAVAFLGWSLNKHLKKAGRAADEGVYGEPTKAAGPEADRSDASTSDASTDTSTADGSAAD
ncbi:hypothetical protein [Nocardioides pelophilus]|uniref:hypothetical protein n=1 Tax=Nocardioides pelophilus TaxID=2172019 RepID=UPI0016036A32|nr:hypothetical protein [Nocardioides pelophilus]